MGRMFGLVAILIAMYLGMQIYTHGIEGAMGSIESTERDSSAFGSHLTGADVTMPTERKRGPVTQRVRDKVTADLQHAAKRRGY